MYSEYQDILYIEYARCLKCIQLFDAFFQFPWMRYYEFFLIMIIFIKILLKNILFGIEEEKNHIHPNETRFGLFHFIASLITNLQILKKSDSDT